MDDGRTPGPTTATPVRGGILRDPVDLRDRAYEPTLAPLSSERLPDKLLLTALRKPRRYWTLPRDQGAEGTCGGQALAALIDLERLRSPSRRQSVSARMLYQTARLKYDPGEPEGVSLRDVIKAFYNYGVCQERSWPYVPHEEPPGAIDVERAREARKVTLGAYYRLRPNLNTYHAALHEAGAVLVSAELHDGWLPDRVRAAGGRILPPPPGQPSPTLGTENHAFLIVGYTPKGFLVLNSWGRDWGGWSPGRGEAPVPGVALWHYGDWADRIIDGWVLRLGAGASDAFEYSIGDMGLGFGPETAAARSTPIHAILGNFLHLDDGEFVTTGDHVSSPQTLRETERLLIGKKQVEGVLLTFAGGLVGLKGAAEQVARWKRLVRDKGWHPFTVLWCVDYVERARSLLDGVFAEAMTRAGKPGPQFDRAAEESAHGIGRALWRDIRCAAEHAARPRGPLHELVRAGIGIRQARGGFRLRIVTESEGAIALAALLDALARPDFAAEAEPFFDMLESVDVIAPPMSPSDYAALAGRLDDGWSDRHPDRGIRLHLPVADDERRLAVPPYGLSYFELVLRAFRRRSLVRDEEEVARQKRADRGVADPKRDFRGFVEPIEAGPSGIATKWDPWATAPRTTPVPIAWGEKGKPDGQGPVTQLDLIYRSDVAGRLRAALAGERARTRELAMS